MIRKMLLAASLVVAFAAPAAAVGMSYNHVSLARPMSLAACLARASHVLSSAGLRLLNPTSAAVWAETDDSQQLYSIYCITAKQLIVVSGAGPTMDMVDPTVNRLVNIWLGRSD